MTIDVRVGETPILLDQEIVRKAVKKLEENNQFDSLRELIDNLLQDWVRGKIIVTGSTRKP